MIKLRAFTKKLSSGFDGSHSQNKRSVSDYDRKHDSAKSTRSSMRRRAISSTRNINTELPPLPTQEFTLSSASTDTHNATNGLETNGKFYVYDARAFRDPKKEDPVDPTFHIFEKPNGINPTSAREVIHALVRQFKDTLIHDASGENDKNINNIKAAMEIFKPNLSHYVPHEIKETALILESFFPRDGCSLKGDALTSEIKNKISSSKSKLILSLRIIWSQLPRGIIPWECYLKFCTVESKQNFSKLCFHNFMPQVLPDADYKRCAFDFMEMLVAIISKVDLVVDKVAQMDLLFTAAQVCFVKTPELLNYISRKSDQENDCITLAKLYRARGEALYRLFVSFLNSLAEEGQIKDFYLIDNFRISEYPPKPYKPLTQRALTITVPQLWSQNINNFNELIRVAAKAQTRTYSSDHTFSKLENSFLDKFEEDPYKVVNTLFSRSSKRYLDKFDPHFDVDFFKTLNKKNDRYSTLGPGDQAPVATWINSCKERGFNDFLSVLDDNNHGEGTLALGFSFPKPVAEDIEVLPPVRISKVDISECFISSWKYETFLGKVHNTLVIKMTKRVGDCEWLVIAMDERTDKYGYTAPIKLTEPSIVKTPPSASKNSRKFHTLSPSLSSIKSRPPPPSLLGEPSSSPLLDSANPVFSERSSLGMSSRPSSEFNTSSVHGKTHLKENSSDLKKDVHIVESPLQQSSPRHTYTTLSSSSPRGVTSSNSSPSNKQSLSPMVESITIKKSAMEVVQGDSRASANKAEQNVQPVEMVSSLNEIENVNAGVTTLENLADSFENDKSSVKSEISINEDASVIKQGPNVTKSADQAKENLSPEKEDSDQKEQVSDRISLDVSEPKSQEPVLTNTANQDDLKSQIPATLVTESGITSQIPTATHTAQENNLESPILTKDSVPQEIEVVSTPINKDFSASAPKMPTKVQNPSIASFGDVTVIPQTNNSAVDTTETTQISADNAKESSNGIYNNSIQKRNSKILQELRKSKFFNDDELTEDLLSDLLENYNTLSTEPINCENGPTVFERVKVYFEREGCETGATQEQNGNEDEEDGESPITQFSKTGSINSKSGTWFSCNVTPPNQNSKKIRNPKKLQLASVRKQGSQSTAHSGLDDEDELFCSTTSDTSDVPDSNGVWLEVRSKPSSPVELNSPTQVMFKNVMMRTKRSLRSLKANH
ncbi:LANO_0A02234g1_1 [Lachancea nothofagi CBS 11611]|uniref:LANO_0A02234g1_1 n=1 Tax=Lachancea nothofagi CBS 11611 TaxID=1266666 RepID=A0A1G4INA2_9SACH|nr:LANO_0A02234g1_1 [Lachancea nothofagi CBS 11611]